MTTETKGRNGGDRAAPRTNDTRNLIKTASSDKALVVGAACWGALPMALAEWLIRCLHLEGA